MPLINNYVQWATTMTNISTIAVTNIDNVTITHTEGAANRDRPFAVNWNREYWLSVATGTNNQSIQYVKSWQVLPFQQSFQQHPYAWNVLYNQNFRSFTKDGNDVFYAGSASSGTFYRLDYGTNDNGNAISAFYDTPDMALEAGDPAGDFRDKIPFEIWLDIDKSPGANFSLGISTNNADFSFANISIDGTGRTIKQYKNLTGYFNTLRLRFGNSELDKGLTVHKAAVVYQPTEYRSTR